MFRADPNPNPMNETGAAADKGDARPEVLDELQLLNQEKGDRGSDDLAFFGLTRTNEERRRRKSRMI